MLGAEFDTSDGCELNPRTNASQKMGPTLLCDKSTIQTLVQKAPELLHHYFQVNIPPILVREILGDLAKDNMELSEMIFEKLADSERTYSAVNTTCLYIQIIDVMLCYVIF